MFLWAFQNSQNCKTFELYETFEEKFICCELGPMSVLWNSFMKLIQILKNFIKFTPTVNWPLHMQVSEHMLKWFFAHAQVAATFHLLLAYSVKNQRDFQTYMTNLCLKNFLWKERGSLSKLPPDQVIERTINKRNVLGNYWH